MFLKKHLNKPQYPPLMASLIACLTTGKEIGHWTHVQRLIEEESWENVFIVTDDYGVRNFKTRKKINHIVIDSKKPVNEVVEDIKNQLKDKIKDTETGLNIVSGKGKEHMAIISALLKLGLGIRLVALTKDGIKEI